MQDWTKEFERLKLLAQQNGMSTLAAVATDKQLEIINDKARFKAVLGGRRSGKTFLAALYLFMTAMKYPGCNVSYITLTRAMCISIMQKDIIEQLCNDHHITLARNLSTLAFRFDNGSVLKLFGMDTGDTAGNRIYGTKQKLICVDECASFNYDLYDLIKSKLRPTLLDQRGSLLMIGCADNIRTGNPFYQLTRPDIENRPGDPFLSGWKTWKISAADNIPAMFEAWKEEVEAMRKVNPNCDSDPTFRQHWLGEWCNIESSLVYGGYTTATRIDSTLTTYGISGNDALADLPKLPEGEDYQYIMTIDPAWTDYSALVVGAHSKFDPAIYIVDAYKQKELLPDQFSKIVLDYKQRYGVNRIYADTQSRSVIEWMRLNDKLNILPALKTDKNVNIGVVNSRFINGRIKIHDQIITKDNVPTKFNQDLGRGKERGYGGTAPLIKELSELIWHPKSLAVHKKYVENPGQPNDLCDCLLYLVRELRFIRQQERAPEKKLSKDSPEYYEQLMRLDDERELKEAETPWFQRTLKRKRF